MLGAGLISADSWRQLEQHFQCRARGFELEQHAVEHEQQHRVSSRSLLWPDAESLRGFRSVRKKKGALPLPLNGKISTGPGRQVSNRPNVAQAEQNGAIMPKTYGNLWQQIVSYENLLLAFSKAEKGKRYRNEALRFKANLEGNLFRIQNELIWKRWEPGTWKTFYVHDPKKRLIQAPPFRDRVVHHALVNVIEPLFERKFIYDSYACRRGKGAHAAMLRVQFFERKMRREHGKFYVLKGDVKQYFPSINHAILKEIIRRTIRDRNALWLIHKILNVVDQGLPIGALTSQLFANVYLNVLDHFIKDALGIRFYVRYMDDFIILLRTKQEARALLETIRDFITTRLALVLNSKTQVFPYLQGIDFCGYRVWPTHILPRKRIVKHARARFRYFSRNFKKDLYPKIKASLMSFLGYMKHCNAQRSKESVIKLLINKGDMQYANI